MRLYGALSWRKGYVGFGFHFAADSSQLPVNFFKQKVHLTRKQSLGSISTFFFDVTATGWENTKHSDIKPYRFCWFSYPVPWSTFRQGLAPAELEIPVGNVTLFCVSTFILLSTVFFYVCVAV
jgi:hypothetical protein